MRNLRNKTAVVPYHPPDGGPDDGGGGGDNDNDSECQNSNAVKKKARMPNRNHVPWSNRACVVAPSDNQDGVIDDSQHLYDIEYAPFCCAHCTCPEGKRQKDNWITPDSTGTKLYHRKCCHGLYQRPDETDKQFQARVRLDEWAPPYLTALDAPDVTDTEQLEWVTPKDIHQGYKASKSRESELHNKDGDVDPTSILLTSEQYRGGIVLPFQKQLKKAEQADKKPKAVVLDCFAGVGTGIVSLKRLGIGIKKVIYIDHDRVSRHVYRSHHDSSYIGGGTEDDDDEIEHVFYDCWEDFVGSGDFDAKPEKLENFLKEHGPVDLVIGGPPCQEYSGVNANRQGTSDEHSGRYLIQLASTIRLLERLQDPLHPLYFCVENVVLDREEKQEVNEAFGFDFDPIQFDSQYVSEARRDRLFWTNIPANLGELNSYIASLTGLTGTSCLEKGFLLPAHIVDEGTIAKCNCLMASKGRLDDINSIRMYVFNPEQKKDNSYHGRALTVTEREKLMGYPVGYVQEPVEELFTLLTESLGQLDNEEGYEFKNHWRDVLPQEYHCFAGNYHKLDLNGNFHRFERIGKYPFVGLKLAPPMENNSVDFFNAQDYSKRLIGLAYSVPVFERLLEPLSGLFQVQKYPGYQYEYCWQKTNKRKHANNDNHQRTKVQAGGGSEEAIAA